MGYCGNCGTKLDDGVKFCPECGKAVYAGAQADGRTVRNGSLEAWLPEEEERVKCPYCGSTQITSRARGWSWKRALLFVLFCVMAMFALLFISFLLMEVNMFRELQDTLIIVGLSIGGLWIVMFFIGGLYGKNDVMNSCMKCGYVWKAQSRIKK